MAIEPITIPTDAVTLHRWPPPLRAAEGEFGDPIGEPVPVSGPGWVTFPPYAGESTRAYIVAWFEGRAMYWHELAERDWPHRPVRVHDGDIVGIDMPVRATLSPV